MKEYQISFRVSQTLYDFFMAYEGKNMSKKGRNILKDLRNGVINETVIIDLKNDNKKLVTELLKMKNL